MHLLGKRKNIFIADFKNNSKSLQCAFLKMKNVSNVLLDAGFWKNS